VREEFIERGFSEREFVRCCGSIDSLRPGLNEQSAFES
jgi:hypothetical protein